MSEGASPKAAAPTSPFGKAAKSRFSEAKGRRTSTTSSPSSLTSSYLEEVRRHMERRGRYTPGPGNYEFKSTFARAAARGKPVGGLAPIRQDTTKISPGPGSYESKVKLGVGKKYTFGSRLTARPRKLPGPGDYNFKSTFSRASKQGIPVGGKAAKRPNISNDILSNPGPGNYEFKSKMGMGPKYTVGARRFDPNYYNP